MSQLQKIAPFAGSVSIYMLTNSCAKSRWIFSRTEELLIVCCCSSQVHGGKPLVFCRARQEETSSRHAFGRVAQHLLWRRGDALEQEDALPDVSSTTPSKAQPRGAAALPKSSVSPSPSCTKSAEVFSSACWTSWAYEGFLCIWKFFQIISFFSRVFESCGNTKVFTPQCWNDIYLIWEGKATFP